MGKTASDTASFMTFPSPSPRLPRYVYLYFFCQSINLIAAIIGVSITAIVGKRIAVNELYATIPYGMQFFILLIGTYPASMMMKRYGRNVGFTIGAISLFLAGGVGYLAVTMESFALLILSHSLVGLFAACANFYRFAVTDRLPVSLQSKALSLVVSGGVLAGVLAPALSSWLWDVSGFASFSLCYAALSLLAVINLVLIVFLPKGEKINTTDNSHDDSKENKGGTARLEETEMKNVTKKSSIFTMNAFRLSAVAPFVLMAIVATAIGYGLMNLMMIQSSLRMDHLHIPFESVSSAIQWHVVAMFLPSFFTGILIARVGHFSIIVTGFILFLVSFMINVRIEGYVGIVIALIILGVAWNFTYVGGSALLAVSLKGKANLARWQGVGDTTVAMCAMIGAMSPSLLLTSIGWKHTNNLAMLVCILVLGGLLNQYIQRRSRVLS